MNICVFDTETVSIAKPFCYNIGYSIAAIDKDTARPQILVEKDNLVEQVWHNPMLFSTAYYAEKRPLYVAAMRGRRAALKKFGHITQEMCRDFERYEVARAFAFNSDFDERVFNFNCDWFKCINPFDTVPISDIRGFVHAFLVDDKYREFCEKNERFTDSGNYSTTAETAFQYLTENPDFAEEHTALADAQIELEILWKCLQAGAELDGEYKAKLSIPREVRKMFSVVDKESKEVLFSRLVKGITVRKNRTEILIEK